MTPFEAIKKWYIDPVRKTGGDGGFIALMVGIALTERLIESQKRKDKKIRKEKEFAEYGFHIFNVPESDFAAFWDMCRNGLMHYAHPFSGKFSTKSNVTWNWFISGDYTDAIMVIEHDHKNKTIEVNPWLWLEIVERKYEGNQDLIDTAQASRLGQIYSIPASEGPILHRTQSVPPHPTQQIGAIETGHCFLPEQKK